MLWCICSSPNCKTSRCAQATMGVPDYDSPGNAEVGGNGWLVYDTYFRQQVAGESSADWSHLNTSLCAVTFLAQGGKGGNCPTCMGSDHSQQDCALFHLQSHTQPTIKRSHAPSLETGSSKHWATPQFCFAWNHGKCQYTRCKYRRACLHCLGDHPMTRCANSREERESRGSNLRDERESRSARGAKSIRDGSKL